MSDGGKGSGRRPGEGYAEGWDAIFGKKKQAPIICGGCGETDPEKRCLGCRHDFEKEPPIQPLNKE